VAHPVRDEYLLKLPGDRAVEAHHDIDPWRIFLLDQEGRVRAVLAAAIARLPVDDDDLAVIAYVDPAEEQAQKRNSRVEGDATMNASACEACPVYAPDQEP